ncbi:MAG: hypothetical protein H7259_00815 [Cytophagales bacterium]|nr:hypothetical protein [Cytophaga sp.]
MTVQSSKKKYIQRFLILLAIPLVLSGIIHYFISYKVKNVLQVLIRDQSNDTYSFDASKFAISIFDKTIIVRNAELISNDTTLAKTHYHIRIPEMYLAIHSWREFYFHGKVSIDSLSFVFPQFKIHEKGLVHITKKKHGTINLATIIKDMKKILLYLEIKSFTLTNGAFAYHTIHAKTVLSSENINFSIRNLSKENKNKRLLYSDDINLSMENQHWILPDGIHTISFKKLEFSGKNQFFELDS